MGLTLVDCFDWICASAVGNFNIISYCNYIFKCRLDIVHTVNIAQHCEDLSFSEMLQNIYFVFFCLFFTSATHCQSSCLFDR